MSHDIHTPSGMNIACVVVYDLMFGQTQHHVRYNDRSTWPCAWPIGKRVNGRETGNGKHGSAIASLELPLAGASRPRRAKAGERQLLADAQQINTS
jgi:hypothetical protein